MRQRFPFSPNPVGWFVVAYSDELRTGAVLPLSYFGTELVAFRGEDGVARVLDAYCPHIGAHLGHGGVVEGASIRCPFHHWCFDGDGVCTKIPYAKKIPPAARIDAWPVCEKNGFVFAWHHPTHADPLWELPALAEVSDPAWTPFDRRRWKIRTNVHEMVENAFDSAHFRYLHALHNLPAPEVELQSSFFRLTSKTVMDTPFGTGIEGMLDIHSWGFGFGTARFTGLIETLLVTTITPIDDQYVDARFSFTVKKLPDEGATALVGKGFVDELCRQVEQDIPIWENKTFFERPLLCDGDGPIGSFRKWARQYYPEGAPTAGRVRRALRVAE
jgi:nitrite reductase/ring-hydroxylating ferredoxin subunit